MIITPSNKSLLKQFVELPLTIYSNDPNWVKPLVGSDISHFSASKAPNPHISTKLFLSVRDSRAAGRAALFIDKLYNKIHKEKTAFFGFFECENSIDTAVELLSAVEDSARKNGMTKVVGPVDYSTNYQAGLLISGFSRPTVMTPYNKEYYRQLIESAGYHKTVDLFSYMFSKDSILSDRIYRISETVKKRRPELSVTSLNNIPNLKASVLAKTYNDSFSDLWGFVPMTTREFSHLINNLSHLNHLNLNYIAHIGRKPVGLLLTVPDLYSGKNNAGVYLDEPAKVEERDSFRRLRLTVLGIVPDFRGKGIEALMGLQLFDDTANRGYEEIEFSVILEDNIPINNLIHREFGLPVDKIFRVYEKQL